MHANNHIKSSYIISYHIISLPIKMLVNNKCHPKKALTDEIILMDNNWLHKNILTNLEFIFWIGAQSCILIIIKYHHHIRSTNSLERLNQEVRRRERVIRIFPNTQSAFRLIGAVLMDIAEEQAKKPSMIGKQ